LNEPLQFTDQPTALCTAYLAFFGDILALPAARSAAILRALKDRNP